MNTILVKYSMAVRHYINNQGYITLLSVLILSAVGLAISVSLILLGIGSSKTSFALEQSAQAKYLTQACVETALQEINDSVPFTGSGGLILGQGTCEYTVSSGGGQNRTIIASSTVGAIIRKAKIEIDAITPKINIIYWQEVADF